MINSIERMNNAVQILIDNQMKKTGSLSRAFTGLEDLKVDVIEMLEFLFQFDGDLEKFEEFTQKNKGESVSTPIDKLMYYLHKIHIFGFLDSSKVENLDTVKELSEIPMKPRHIVYLNILRGIKPDIEKLFIDAYNQTHKERNPFRVEQVLFYLRELLEYDGIKTEWKHFRAAVPFIFTGNWKPYFCKSNYNYYVIDSFGGYGGSLGLLPKNLDGTGIEWFYSSCRWANSSHGDKSQAEAEVIKLRQLNAIAGIVGLDWTVKCENRNEIVDAFHSLSKEEQIEKGEFIYIINDVPKGKITLHKRLERELFKKHKAITKRIAEAWKTKGAELAAC